MDLSPAALNEINIIVGKRIAEELVVANHKLDDLAMRLDESQKEVVKLKTDLASTNRELAKAHRELEEVKIKTDDVEQYTRRTNIRIEGLPYTKGEENSAIRDQVVRFLKKADISASPSDIQRCHRSSAPKQYKGITTAQTIVRFNLWDIRRRCHGLNKLCKRKDTGFRVYADLTTRRLKLYNDARNKIDQAQRDFYGQDLSNLSDAERVFAFVDGGKEALTPWTVRDVRGNS